MPPVTMRRVWVDNTRLFFDLQPFCAAELKNNKHHHTSTHSQPAKTKDDVVVGCDQGVLLFYELNAIETSLAVVGGLSLGATTQIDQDRIRLSRCVRLSSREPVTHIYELTGANQSGLIIVAQIDGTITVLNHLTGAKVVSLSLN